MPTRPTKPARRPSRGIGEQFMIDEIYPCRIRQGDDFICRVLIPEAERAATTSLEARRRLLRLRLTIG